MNGYLTKEPRHPYGHRVRRFFVLDAERGVLSLYRSALTAGTPGDEGKSLSLRRCALADAPEGFRLVTRGQHDLSVVLHADSRSEELAWRWAISAALARHAEDLHSSHPSESARSSCRDSTREIDIFTAAEPSAESEEADVTALRSLAPEPRARLAHSPPVLTPRLRRHSSQGLIGAPKGALLDVVRNFGPGVRGSLDADDGAAGSAAEARALLPAGGCGGCDGDGRWSYHDGLGSAAGVAPPRADSERGGGQLRSSSSSALRALTAGTPAQRSLRQLGSLSLSVLAGLAPSAPVQTSLGATSVVQSTLKASAAVQRAQAETAAPEGGSLHSAEDESPSRCRTVLLLTVACLHIASSAGIIFGWAALEPLLRAEGVFAYLCDDGGGDDLGSSVVGALPIPHPAADFGSAIAAASAASTSAESAPSCPAATLRLNLVFAMGSLGSNLSNCVFGALLDARGPRSCNAVASIILLAGALLMAAGVRAAAIPGAAAAGTGGESALAGAAALAVAAEALWRGYGIAAGFFLLGFAGPGIQMPAYQLSALLPGSSASVLSLFASLFNASECLFALFAALHTSRAHDGTDSAAQAASGGRAAPAAVGDAAQSGRGLSLSALFCAYAVVAVAILGSGQACWPRCLVASDAGSSPTDAGGEEESQDGDCASSTSSIRGEEEAAVGAGAGARAEEAGAAARTMAAGREVDGAEDASWAEGAKWGCEEEEHHAAEDSCASADLERSWGLAGVASRAPGNMANLHAARTPLLQRAPAAGARNVSAGAARALGGESDASGPLRSLGAAARRLGLGAALQGAPSTLAEAGAGAGSGAQPLPSHVVLPEGADSAAVAPMEAQAGEAPKGMAMRRPRHAFPRQRLPQQVAPSPGIAGEPCGRSDLPASTSVPAALERPRAATSADDSAAHRFRLRWPSGSSDGWQSAWADAGSTDSAHAAAVAARSRRELRSSIRRSEEVARSLPSWAARLAASNEQRPAQPRRARASCGVGACGGWGAAEMVSGPVGGESRPRAPLSAAHASSRAIGQQRAAKAWEGALASAPEGSEGGRWRGSNGCAQTAGSHAEQRHTGAEIEGDTSLAPCAVQHLESPVLPALGQSELQQLPFAQQVRSLHFAHLSCFTALHSLR